MKQFPLFLLTLVSFLCLQSCESTPDIPVNQPIIPQETPAVDSSETVTPPLSSTMDTLPRNKAGYIEVSWKTLAKMKFESRYNEELSEMVDYPIFHEEVKMLDQQLIEIEGYVIPFEETGSETIVILSAFPYSNCFFCGGAGPESVLDVQMKKNKQRFRKDDKSIFRGRLRLNDTDLDYLNYILEEAEVKP